MTIILSSVNGPSPRSGRAAIPFLSERVPKKLFIKTYGCQMNVYDSERMADVLAPLDYALCARPRTRPTW